jgi:segregation and condensation protein A
MVSVSLLDFRVDLNLFRGPMDLLLYLVRKHELEVVDIPIAKIAEQYLQYIAVLEQLDVDAVGDFLATAATLIEIKSQQVLPRSDEIEEEIDDPRAELVHRLLEYKKYRDAASVLEDQSRRWQQQYARLGSDLPLRQRDLAEESIQEVELWDLVSAFARILRTAETSRPSNIVYDETPIHVYMERIAQRLEESGGFALVELFEAGMHKSQLVGLFLAVLELVRHHRARVEQTRLFGEVRLLPREGGAAVLDGNDIDNYDHRRAS